ncbi:MAG: PAS domain-containing protein [Deltaproteobacteria bacterium]|nr:PAS domain-containing protein [Deltaproteobacteria bacterium]
MSKIEKTSESRAGIHFIGSEMIYHILEKITDGFFVVDRQWTILFANEPATQIAKKPFEQVLGKNLWDIVPQYVGTEIYDHYQKSMLSGNPTSFITYLEEFNVWLETRLFPSNEGLTSYFRDITAQIKAESKLKETMKGLERKTNEVSRSNRELAEFAAIASHDLKEPLKSISLWLDLAHQNKKDVAKTEDCIRHASENTKKLLGLIDSLLEYSQIGKDHASFKCISCETIIENVKTSLLQAIEGSGATIEYKCLPHIYADEIQLTRLFQNLLSNAIKYRSPERAPHIKILTSETCDSYQFRVEDNGIGIRPADFESIFQIFQRSENATGASGNGIGLATVKKIVELHGGEISLESELGYGSCFKFSIPKHEVGTNF